jgi:adenosylmethionine-8-amino-7-oxononanoate aminotransferase
VDQALNPAEAAELLARDRAHAWHPYASMTSPPPAYPVVAARGVRLRLADGRELIDGMASWWAAIHGYNHPVLNAALRAQLDKMAHVMFGGITHPAAAELCELLAGIAPGKLPHVFLSDSGSVAVEVGIKMALQFHLSQGCNTRKRLLSLRGGYHGDTFMAMSVCDPVTGMHHLFSGAFPAQVFAPRPEAGFDAGADDAALAADIAGFDAYEVLLIADEIATGFGRTGKLFACEHAGIAPDILCIGKALTGGYMSLAATLASERVSRGICEGEAGVLMHGPTFMGNPLACSVALASIRLLLSQPWQRCVKALESGLREGLAPAARLPGVREVRVLGGIGVVEMHSPVDMTRIQRRLVDRGVWIRPFGRLVYTMPPLIMQPDDLATLTRGIVDTLETLETLDEGEN